MVSSKLIIITVILVVGLVLCTVIWSFSADSRTYLPNQDNREQSSCLHRNLEPGEAYVWYLGGCGFAVRTQHHLLVFDYQEKYDEQWLERPSEPFLSDGYINPQEIENLNVCVFTSHQHRDHFDPVIFNWENGIRRIRYVFG